MDILPISLQMKLVTIALCLILKFTITELALQRCMLGKNAFTQGWVLVFVSLIVLNVAGLYLALSAILTEMELKWLIGVDLLLFHLNVIGLYLQVRSGETVYRCAVSYYSRMMSFIIYLVIMAYSTIMVVKSEHVQDMPVEIYQSAINPVNLEECSNVQETKE